jgi:heme-degrading monooxygenase HmoA
MYISRSEGSVGEDRLEDARAEVARVHEFMRTMPGFRWAMLLRSLVTPEHLAAVSMWTSPEQASSQDGAVLGAGENATGYDVTTARGSMTPASHVVIVDWQVGEEVAARFANRWNAAYHAVEERIGSRLLRDLVAPNTYAGLHAVTDESSLGMDVLTSPVSDAEGLSVGPVGVQRFEVLLLTEA